MLDLRSAMQAVALKRLAEHAAKTQTWPTVFGSPSSAPAEAATAAPAPNEAKKEDKDDAHDPA